MQHIKNDKHNSPLQTRIKYEYGFYIVQYKHENQWFWRKYRTTTSRYDASDYMYELEKAINMGVIF